MVRFLLILSHGLLTNYDLNLATWSMFLFVNLVTWMANNVWVEFGFVCNGICLNQLNLRAYRSQDIGFIPPHWQLEKTIRQHKGCQVSAVIQRLKSKRRCNVSVIGPNQNLVTEPQSIQYSEQSHLMATKLNFMFFYMWSSKTSITDYIGCKWGPSRCP